MVQLMELGTSLQAPDSLKLENPEAWDKEIVNFLEQTATCSGETLQKVRWPLSFAGKFLTRQDVFIEKSPESHCLKPLVFITERSVERDWEFCMR
jgi:hypothetical protein